MPEDLRTIRRKIRTVTSVAQITRAMKMVAAARLRRSQQVVANSRPYWEGIRELARHLVGSLEEASHPFLSQEEPQRVALVVVAGDRGLCGSYNSLVFRRADQALRELPVALIIGVGEKVASWAAAKGKPLHTLLPGYGGKSVGQVHLRVANLLRACLDEGLCDGAYAVHTPFRSSLQNIADVVRLLPMEREELRAGERVPYLFEPRAAEVLDALLPRALEAHVAQLVIEGAAAEQAARVAAMTAASDNAEELMDELTRLRNRIRQQEITTEIMEVIGGAEAISAD